MLLEIDPTKVRKARRMGYNAVKGDIRRIPFGPLWFDMIFDFSTIDHIPPEDVESALKEYHRVLKNDGILYLVAWCSHERSYQERGCEQYYFEYHRFRESVKKHFKILDGEALYRCNTILYLMAFLCRPHKMIKS
jgi:ubiquinone/menaquinone biosynthesis C-methylase UbiE